MSISEERVGDKQSFMIFASTVFLRFRLNRKLVIFCHQLVWCIICGVFLGGIRIPGVETSPPQSFELQQECAQL